jgi:hypothetical protein
MSETTLSLKLKAALLKERYDQANNEEDIEVSESFLAEDYRECLEKIAKLATQPFIEYNARHGYPYADCQCKLVRGRWKRNPKLQRDTHVERLAGQ